MFTRRVKVWWVVGSFDRAYWVWLHQWVGGSVDDIQMLDMRDVNLCCDDADVICWRSCCCCSCFCYNCVVIKYQQLRYDMYLLGIVFICLFPLFIYLVLFCCATVFRICNWQTIELFCNNNEVREREREDEKGRESEKEKRTSTYKFICLKNI